MPEEKPISEQILDTAVALLRRHGVDKMNVVDIARAMSMSHGNIYRYFPSKQALVEAVAARWLQAVTGPLDAIVGNHARPASKRLEAWFGTLREIKKRKVLDDPELFQMYQQIAAKISDVAAAHIAHLHEQLETIFHDGVKAGEFSRRLNPATAARAFLQATASFHHPALLLQSAPTDAEAQAVFKLLLAGIKAA